MIIKYDADCIDEIAQILNDVTADNWNKHDYYRLYLRNKIYSDDDTQLWDIVTMEEFSDAFDYLTTPEVAHAG